MYEKYLSTFVFDPHPDIPHCVIKLTEPPFVGVRVCIGTRLEVAPAPDGKNLKFDYHVLENSDFDSGNTEFVGLLGGIVLALIERAAKNETKQ